MDAWLFGEASRGPLAIGALCLSVALLVKFVDEVRRLERGPRSRLWPPLAATLAQTAASGLVAAGWLTGGGMNVAWGVPVPDVCVLVAVATALFGVALFPPSAWAELVRVGRHVTAWGVLRSEDLSGAAARAWVRRRTPVVMPALIALLASLPIVAFWGDPRLFGYATATAMLYALDRLLRDLPTYELAALEADER